MVILICYRCSAENEVESLEDTKECGDCGIDISKENSKYLYQS